MINAKPNLNGNTEKDFCDAALQLTQALAAVEQALGNIRSNVFHGRNYQHITDWQMNSARAGDDAAMRHAEEAVSKINYLATQIVEKVMEDAV